MNSLTPSSSGGSKGRQGPQARGLSRVGRDQERQTHVQCRLCRRWYRAVTYTHLRYRHGIKNPRQYKQDFSLSKITSGEVRQKIADRKFLVDRHALDYIRRTWGRRTIKEITAYLGINASTVRAHARRMGFGLLVEKWDVKKVLRGLRRARREGLPLNSGHARRQLGHLYKAAIQHFRSWRNALREAGISYEKVALRGPFEAWTRDRIAAELQELFRQGRDRDYPFIQTQRPKLYAAARNHFGSWKAARQAAGLPDSTGSD